jgi:hypothetical protein
MPDINELISPEALKSVNDLEATFAKIVTVIDSIITKSKSLDQVIATLNKEADVQSQLNKVAKDAINLNKQQQLAEDDIVKAKIRFQNATKDQREELKALVTLEDSEAGYLEKVRAKIAQLNQEKNKIKETDKDWQKQIANINKEIDKNNQILKENSSQLGKQKIGIGGYADGIKSAVVSMISFGGVLAIAVGAIDKLYDAFAQTEAGAKFTSEIKEITKTFLQNLIPSIKQYWQAFFSGDAEKAKQVQLDMVKNSADAVRAAGELDKLRISQRTINEQNAKDETAIHKLRIEAAAETSDTAKQLKILTEAEKLEDDIIQRKKDHLKAEIEQYTILSNARKDNTELLDILSKKNIELTDLEGDHSLRIAQKIAVDKEKLDKVRIESEKNYQKIRDDLADHNLKIQQDAAKGVGDAWKNSVSEEKNENDFKEKELKLFNITSKDLGLQHNKDLDDQMAEREAKSKKEAADRLKIEREKYKIIGDIVNEAEQIENNIVNGKIQKLEQQKDAELSNTKLTADQKTAINNKYAKEENALKRKAAQIEKLEGIFSIAISTAKNVAAASNPVMMAMIPWIIAQGVAEAAIVASKPLPSYAKGTHYASGGPSVVSEQGREMIISPSGAISLSPDDPTIMNIERGSKIIPSEETKRIIEAARTTKRNDFEAVTERRHKELINTIKNKRELILSSSTGHYITEREGSTYKNYFKRHLQ